MVLEDTLGRNTNSNIHVKATEYLNRPISALNLAQRNIENGRKGFADASDYLETCDDSDIITALNAQNDLRHPAKWWHNHSTSQYQSSGINGQHTEVVGTELRLKLNNPRQLRFSNTSSREIEEKPSS